MSKPLSRSLPPKAKTSDAILALVGSRSLYLCNELHMAALSSKDNREALFDAMRAISDFIDMRRPGYAALINVLRQTVREDGIEQDSVPEWYDGPAYHAWRDKWCLDYATFLKEFGL